MGFFNGLFRSRDKPTNRTAGSSYAFFLGGSTAGKMVTERSAMQMTAVYSCVRILSEAIAELPLHVYKYTDSGGKEKAVDHPLYLLLHDEPNPEMSSFVFRETLMTHLLLWGNAYAQIIRNGKGEVVALYPLMPNKMSVDRDENGQLYYRYNKSSDEAATMPNNTVILHQGMCCISPDSALTVLSDTHRLLWRRTLSVLPSQRKSTERSSSLTAQLQAASSNTPARLRTRQEFVKRGRASSEVLPTPARWPFWKKE